MSIVGPRPTVQVQVDQYTERQRGRLAVKPGITGWAQVNGRASLPWSERIELDLWYVEHRSLRLDLKIVLRTLRWWSAATASTRERPVAGAEGRAGVLLTGVGKRYDIVSAFAQHATVVAADPNPLAPGAVRRHRARGGAADRRPRLRPRRCRSCASATTSARSSRSPTSTSRSSPARAPTGVLPAFVPDPEVAAATYDKYETHLLLERLGLPSPPTVLPGEEPAVLPGDGQAAPRLGRALDPPAPPTPRRRRSSVRYVDEPVMVQRLMDGPEFSIDCLSDLDGRCLNAIPRTMLESRGGESIKGTVIADRRAGRPGPRRGGGAAACAGRAPCRPSATARSASASPTSTRASAAPSRRPMYAALPGRTYPELIVRMAAASGRAPRRRVPRRDDVHALLLAARARRGDAAHGPRHRRAAGPPARVLEWRDRPGRRVPATIFDVCAEVHDSHAFLLTRGDPAVAELAARQHGVVSTGQLRALGLERGAIQWRVRRRRLHPLHRGVFAVGHGRLAFQGRLWAAVLACGGPEVAALSHRTAAAVWDLLPAPPERST